jgi:hypothetical protein
LFNETNGRKPVPNFPTFAGLDGQLKDLAEAAGQWPRFENLANVNCFTYWELGAP